MSSPAVLDPRTPVLAGVGQVSERLGQPGYRRRSAADLAADGWAVVETYTVVHGRDGGRTGIVIGRLEADGRRFVARGDDPALVELLATAPEPVGQQVCVRSAEAGNRVTVS